MRYFLAFLFPPAAILLCGKPIQAILNLFLTCLYFPGVIHALMVISETEADRRQRKLIKAIKASGKQPSFQPAVWIPKSGRSVRA